MFRSRLGVLEGLGAVLAIPTSAEIVAALNAFIGKLTLANWRTLLGSRVLTTDGKTASAMTDAALSDYVTDLVKYLKIGGFANAQGLSASASSYRTSAGRLTGNILKETWTNTQVGAGGGLWDILTQEANIAIVVKKDTTYRETASAAALTQEAAMDQYRRDRGQYTSADSSGMVKWIIGGIAAWFALKG